MVLLRIALILLFLAPISAQAKRPSILVLQAYHPGLSWTDELNRGIADAFRQQMPEALLWVEYLDTKRNPSPRHLQLMANLLLAKLEGQHFDLILACDNTALEFTRTTLAPRFPDAAIVFCGINGFTPDMISGLQRVGGITEEPAFAETIRLALHLHPSTKEIVVIGGDQLSPDDITDRALRALAPQFAPIRFAFWNNLDASTLRQRLPQLGPESIILVHGVLRNEEGILLDYRDKNRFLAEHAQVPIYGFWDFEMGGGCVGGMMLESYAHGYQAASLAVEVLRTGALPPIRSTTAYAPIFDYQELLRFGIDPQKLPPGARILGEPPRFYRIPKEWTWAMALGIGLLCALLALSFLALRLRRIAQEGLMRHAAHLEHAVAERTRHLREANAELEREVAERIQAENALRKAQARLQIEVERRTRDLAFEIAQRRQAEALLRDREAKARALLNAPSETLLLVDARGVILDINDTGAQRIGGNRESLLGMRLDHILDPALAATCARAMEQALATQSPQAVTQMGPPADYDIRVAPVPLEGDDTDRLAIFLADVTETRRLGRRLVLLDKISSLGRMAAGLAHEIRNPLSGILGYLDAVDALAAELTPEHQARLSQLAHKMTAAAQKIEGVIRRVLDFSKPTTPHFQVLDLREPVADALGLMATAMRRRHVHVEAHLPKEPVWIRADKPLVEQIAVNLADNAARAAQSQNTRPPAVHITVTQEATVAKLKVEDSGPGVRPEEQERIFEPFYTTAVDGTGIGLAIVQRILADHGGSIQVASSPLGGAAFVVEFPRTAPPKNS
jgi:signal transduction histidine kinase